MYNGEEREIAAAKESCSISAPVFRLTYTNINMPKYLPQAPQRIFWIFGPPSSVKNTFSDEQKLRKPECLPLAHT